MDKYAVRGKFEKYGRAVFISHLDLFRTMQRAMKRSGIPVWYSQGYNPRIYLNFPLALSLGVESCTEFMDFEIVEQMPYDEMMDSINKVLPEGLHFVEMNAPVSKNKEISLAEYELFLSSHLKTPSELKKSLEDFMQQDEINVEKHSKSKGVITLDIKPYINIISAECSEDFLRITIRLPAGMELNINSNVFCDAFIKYCGCEFDKFSVKRTKILRNDGTEFA